MREEELRRLYHDKGMTLREIGDHFGVTHGTVRNHMKKHGIPRRRARCDKLGSHHFDEMGYERFRVYDGGQNSSVRIHRLAAVAWFGLDAVAGNDVHHKNGRRFDNREENLEPISREEHTRRHKTNG